MATKCTSLYEKSPRRYDIPIVTLTSLVLLVLGQSLPVVTVDTLGPSKSTYSILSGIFDLVGSGNVLIALILLVFSVIFPILKLAGLLLIWFRKLEAEQRTTSLTFLKLFGKWSMLDVFVVVVLVGSIKLGFLAEAAAEPGIYVFASAILLSLIATFLTARVAEGHGAGDVDSVTWPAPRLKRKDTALAIVALALFAAGLGLPIMHVEEWVFWDREYSILAATWELFTGGEFFLATLVFVFVVLLPFVGFVTLVALSFVASSRSSMNRGMTWLGLLNKWSMVDVFGLAVTVVVAKIGGFAHVEPRVGLWTLAGAAALSAYLSWKVDGKTRHRAS